MQEKKFVYYQEDDKWIGWLEEYPDYWTQGLTLEELKENLEDIEDTAEGLKALADEKGTIMLEEYRKSRRKR